MSDSPLRHIGFRRYLIARALSAAGSWMQTVTAGYLVYRLTHSPLHVGMLAAIAKGPNIVVAPLGGWLSDRFDRRRLAVVLGIAQVAPAAVLALLTFDGDVSTTEVLALTFCIAVPAGLKRPGVAEMVPELVPEQQCKRAMTDAASTFNVASLLGPVLGGGLVATMGAGASFGVTALLFIGMVAALLSIPAASIRQRDRPGAWALTTSTVLMWRSLQLRALLGSALMFFLFVGPLEQIMPVVAADHGDGAHYIGVLLGAIALGGLLGSPIVRGLQRHETSELSCLAIGLIVAGLLMIGLALSDGLVLDLVAIVLIGATWEVIWVTESTGVHFRSPANLSGQAMGLLYMISSVSIGLGALFIGWTTHRVGLEWSLTISGLGLMLLGPCPLIWARRRIPARREGLSETAVD